MSVVIGEPVAPQPTESAAAVAVAAAVTETVTELAAPTLDAVQAAAIFEELPVESLTVEQAAEIVEAVQKAKPEVRKAFEDTVDVFSGNFDNYTPWESKITVGQRRTVVAGTAILVMMPAPVPTRRRP